jgi:hypothetical protein
MPYNRIQICLLPALVDFTYLAAACAVAAALTCWITGAL